MRKVYRIAGIPIELVTEKQLIVVDGFKPFVTNANPEYSVCFREVVKLNITGEIQLVTDDGIINVMRSSDGKDVRVYYPDMDKTEPYAVRYADYTKRLINVDYLLWGMQYVNEEQNAFFHVALDELMLQEEKMILHSSLVASPYGGIVFTGPSGIGKSTQADLWAKYRDAQILNGDRTILGKENNNWYGYGSPYAGSSQYYVNEKSRVAAIIVLDQSEHDTICCMDKKKAFRAILQGTTVCNWNSEYVVKTCDLIISLIEEVPVYHLSCTKTVNAVKTVEEVLKGNS